MGLGGSKEELTDQEKFVYDKTKISFDEYGNLRYNGPRSQPVDREAEMKAIMAVDQKKEIKTEESTWYLADSAWVELWLQYVHVSQDCPRPGPCRNERLIQKDENGKWVGRPAMRMAVKTRKGDYRRVSEEAWNAIKQYYPGSGPDITMKYKYDERLQDSGAYDVSTWTIIADQALNDTGKSKRGLTKFLSRISISGNESVDNRSSVASESLATGTRRESQNSDDDDTTLLNPSASPLVPPGAKKASPLTSRSFLGSKAGNEPKDSSAYKKVEGSQERPSIAAAATAADEEDAAPRESFFADVFFGGGATTAE